VRAARGTIGTVGGTNMQESRNVALDRPVSTSGIGVPAVSSQRVGRAPREDRRVRAPVFRRENVQRLR